MMRAFVGIVSSKRWQRMSHHSIHRPMRLYLDYTEYSGINNRKGVGTSSGVQQSLIYYTSRPSGILTWGLNMQ